jgi:acyl-CoA thioesterase-1
MNWIIYFFGSGTAFFAGVGLIAAAIVALGILHRKWTRRIALLFAALGFILITFSATPLPYWFYAVAAAVSLIWLLAERLDNQRLRRCRLVLRLIVAVVWIAAAVSEIRYSFLPTFAETCRGRLYLFADSVSAGMGEADLTTWPSLLAAAQPIEVANCSQMGAKVSTMRRKADELSLGDGLVVLEIGGNDLLGSTSLADFERDLDELLKSLRGPGRIVVMFELPLPPFRNGFGRAQRRLAQKHNVQLIPKRVFVEVLTAEGATVDSVHLSRRGHELMAATVWDIIQPAFATHKK